MATDPMTPCLPPLSGRRAAMLVALMTLLWLAAFMTPMLFAQARGPILVVTPSPNDFDTTMCGTTKCASLTFSNAGDTTLRVYSVNQIDAPFSGTIPTPFELAPGAARSFPVCYAPTTRGSVDRRTITYRADTRVSLSIGMLFDVSGSMTARMSPSDPTTRIAAAHSAGRSFVDNILTTPDIRDEAAVYQFAAAADYAVRQNWTSDRNALRNAVPAAAPGAGTCLYGGIAQSSAHIAPRDNRKVLIVLTDGAEACNGSGATPQTAIAAAQAAGVRVFTIGIGAANGAVLTQIANATGGRYFTATSASDLAGVYRTIATLLSQDIEGSFELRGRSVSPFMVIDPIIVAFDSTRVGSTSCLPVVVRNTGDAPLTITGVDDIAAPFTLTSLPGAPILPGDSVTLEVCFTPDRLRVLSGAATFRHNACGQDPVALPIRGIGYDTLTLAIRGTYTARPGSIIEIPVVLEQPLPAVYDVESLTLTVAYDKTVLYPSDRFITTEGTMSASMPSTTHSSVYGASEASTRVELAGDLLSSAEAGGTVVRLAFMVLHGSSLTTDVRITGALFADGNPRTGWIDTARVVADSLCYQADRLIDASGRYGRIFMKVMARRDGASGSAEYVIADGVRTVLTLHDALGREVLRPVDDWRDAGTHTAELDMSSLPNGTYYLRISAGRESDVRVITVAK